METRTKGTADHIGVKLGRIWSGVGRQEARLIRWAVCKGMPASFTKLLLWIFKLIVIAALLYAAMWLTIILVIAVGVAAIIGREARHSRKPEWLPKPTDHRDELFYDPLTYNDDPDPRFKDD